MRFIYNSKLVKYLLPKRYCAITISSKTCLVRDGYLKPSMRRHEMVHGVQFKREGWVRFVFNYIRQNLTYGYWDNKYEQEARKAERE